MPLQICIRADTLHGTLRLEVANTGEWWEADQESPIGRSNGIGLRLVREHLEHKYSGKYRWTCFEGNSWVVQRIEIPDLTKEPQDDPSCAVG